ncbi:hypothetical protein D3C81_1957970 [compost metagenome]
MLAAIPRIRVEPHLDQAGQGGLHLGGAPQQGIERLAASTLGVLYHIEQGVTLAQRPLLRLLIALGPAEPGIVLPGRRPQDEPERTCPRQYQQDPRDQALDPDTHGTPP